jgi:hypothetical protein
MTTYRTSARTSRLVRNERATRQGAVVALCEAPDKRLQQTSEWHVSRGSTPPFRCT